jgi:hypothetical protein
VEDLRTWKAEHEAWVAAATADAPRDVPWTAIVQEDGQRIDIAEASGALGAGNRATQLVELRSDPAREGWMQAASRECRTLELMLTTTPAENRRFAVFSMARIPLAVQLGYGLADRARVALFQYDRDRGSWSWDATAEETAPVTCEASRCVAGTADEAAIRVSLSAEVPAEPRLRCAVEVAIRVATPSVRWLRAPAQLTGLARAYDQALAKIRARGCRRIHLFYAGPAAGAVAFGRAYNARMNPPLELYEYRHGATPCYDPVLTLNRS